MKRITILLLSILCLTACSNDNDMGIEKPELQQQITLSIPNAATVSVYSAASEIDCTIDTLWVMAFDGTGAKRWIEKIEGSRIVNNGQASQLLPQLKNEPIVGDRIVCISNVINPDTSFINYATINQHFPFDNDLNVFLDVPMYGEMIWNPTSSYTCVMTRAMAKVEVQLAPNYYDATGNFDAETVTWGADCLPYGGLIQPTNPMEGVPHTFGWLGFPITNALLQRENPREILPEFMVSGTTRYAFEYPSSIRNSSGGVIVDSVFESERAHILLLKMTPTDTSYYRLDFFDHATGKFLDIKRNHHYIFTINSVRSEGYRPIRGNNSSDHVSFTPVFNYGSNLDYTIRVMDNSRAIISNGQYAIVTTVDTIKLPAGAVTVPAATFFRYEDPEGQLSSIGLAQRMTENIIAVEDIVPAGSMTVTPIGEYHYEANGDPWAIPPIPPMGPPYVDPALITDTNQPLDVAVDASFVSGTVFFKLGNIQHRVYVVRE